MMVIRTIRLFLSALIALIVLVVMARSVFALESKEEKPLPPHLMERMRSLDIDPAAPIYMRAFKNENIIEVWKQARNGRYQLIASYEICKWSGKLGPKQREGDYQTPEGFYIITPGQLHPKSNYHLAFNVGYPNAYDRANGFSGSYLMVHGNCLSIGCYAMTNLGIEQIYAFAREAFKGGQKSFAFHAFPFRMNGKNMALNGFDKASGFWWMIKPGYDVFELTKIPPRVEVCGRNYVIGEMADSAPTANFCQIDHQQLTGKLDANYVRLFNLDYRKTLAMIAIQDKAGKL